MIVYGYRSTHLRSALLQNTKCPNCETKNQMTASVYGRHVHIFWIPLFPAGKTSVFECQHCHKGFKKKELNEDGKLAFKNFKSSVKTPLWKYSGLLIIGLLIALGVYSSKQKDSKTAEYIANPALNDVYTFKTNQNYYSTFKIIQVFKDSIYVNYNNLETSKLSGIRKIDKAKNYNDSLYYVLTPIDIETWQASGDLKSVKR